MTHIETIGLGYLVLAVVTMSLSASVGYWVYHTRKARGRRTFVLMAGIAVLWAGSVAVHVLTDDVAVMRAVVRLELGYGLAEAVLWTVFCSQYANSDFHQRRSVQAAFGATAVAYLGLLATDPGGLLFLDIPVYQEPFPHASAKRGVGYFAMLAAIYGIIASSFLVLTEFLFSTRRGARARMMLLVIGVLSILGLNVLSILDMTPVETFEHAAFGIFPFTLLMTIGIFRLGLLDVVPVGRDTVVETLDDAVVVVDERRRVVDFNPRARRLRPSLVDHVGKPLSGVLPALDEQIPLDPESVVTDQFSLETDEGVRYFSVRVSPLAGEGSADEVIGYSVLLRDITELEESRRELQRQNEQLDRFASIVSHDLRNPMSVVEGYADKVEARLDDLEDQGADVNGMRDDVERICAAQDRMEAIVSDVLTITRESKSVEETTAVEFERVVREAWHTVDPFDATLAIDGGGTIRADPDRLRTIFENLFRNAADHSRDPITVWTAVETGGFYVEDTGPGIPADRVDDVFEYGFTTSDDGTGLGLSIVRTMAQSHGWSVRVDDEYDGGTRFVFSGAIADPATPEDERADATGTRADGGRQEE